MTGPVVAIHQPNFMPWAGFFEKARRADVFVLLDDVQFSKGSYTNRRELNGRWVTVPVHAHGKPLIKDVRLASDFRWEGMSADKGSLLVDLTIPLIYEMALLQNIPVLFVRASSVRQVPEKGADGLLQICRALGARAYLSGPSGEKYDVQTTFDGSGIEVFPFAYTERTT